MSTTHHWVAISMCFLPIFPSGPSLIAGILFKVDSLAKILLLSTKTMANCPRIQSKEQKPNNRNAQGAIAKSVIGKFLTIWTMQ